MISIVDDDKSVRNAARALLKSLGYSTATFGSAEEFLQSGLLQETDCLITDVQMPGMSGFDLQDHLIASGDMTPVIFVTALPEKRLRERALGAGALGFLTKPFSEDSLIACLEKALSSSPSIAPSTLAEPFGAAVALRVGLVEDLVPPGDLPVADVGEGLGDDALKVGVDAGPVKRSPFADDAAG
ncbi:MAG: response regulator [Bradyrhizobium sp.]|nr:response regulator [Bradyrhizobium sp.]